MGHTKPPFTMQFGLERGYLSEFRRGLLLLEDQRLFEDMWDKAEFHIPACEKAAHPLPIVPILMGMMLEAEKSALRLEKENDVQSQELRYLKEKMEQQAVETAVLHGEIERLREELKKTLAAFREEMLEIKYPLYVS